MHPDYEKRLREIKEWEHQRAKQEIEEKKAAKAKTPNLECMPLGCWFWIIVIAGGIFYGLRGCAGVV